MLNTYPYKPIGGINSEDMEDSLGEMEVRSATNFLFERQQFVTRPGVVGQTPVGFTGDINFAKSLRIGFPAFTFLVSSNGKIYKLTSPTAVTEITGAGTSFTILPFVYSEAVNGVVMIAANSTGMIRWDIAGATYSVVPNSNYIYVTSHLNRAIGANKMDGAFGDDRRVGWSQSGDETLWTGGDSGTADLVDLPDDITGLCVLHNILVILRRTGIHLGTATGISLPVYNFQTWGRNVPGCQFSSTVDTWNNTVYYVSQDDVYTFNLQEVTPIGGKIRRELIALKSMGFYFRGFISRIDGAEPRARYNLVPIGFNDGGGDLAVALPHFVYDIQDHTWSRHIYGMNPEGGFYYLQPPADEYPTVFSKSQIFKWDPNVATEVGSQLVSRLITLGAEEDNVTLRRILLKYRNYGVGQVTLAARANQNDTLVEDISTNSVGVSTADQRLLRSWFNFQGVAGQDFQIQLDIPPGQRFAGNYMGLRLAGGGEFKGDTRD